MNGLFVGRCCLERCGQTLRFSTAFSRRCCKKDTAILREREQHEAMHCILSCHSNVRLVIHHDGLASVSLEALSKVSLEYKASIIMICTAINTNLYKEDVVYVHVHTCMYTCTFC